MSGNFIVSTPKSEMHALAYQGIIVSECHAQLRDMVRHKFGDSYVLLFAEPVPNAATGVIDWYTPVQGAVRRLVDLPPDEQNTIRDKLAQMAGEMRRYADELRQTADSAKLTRGNILNLSLSYPDERALYVVGGQPVITCWGHGPGTPGAEPQDLCRITRITAPASAPEAPSQSTAAQETPQAVSTPPPPPTARTGCLPWLLPLLLALLLILLLFTSFNGLPPLGGKALWHIALPEVDISEITELRKRNDALELTLIDLRGRLEAHAALCRPNPEKKKIRPPMQKEETGEELVIPEKEDSIAFLHGRWSCRTGLANTSTGEPVVVEFAFDTQGHGEAVVYEKNDTCRGPARAERSGDGLRITVDGQRCGKGGGYSAQKIECKNDGRAAQCFGANEGGDPWEARFFRIAD